MADHQEFMQHFHTVELKLTFEYCACKGCEGKVRKQMKKVDGIYEKSLTIDKEQGVGTLVVSGRFHTDKLITKLMRAKNLREVENISVEKKSNITGKSSKRNGKSTGRGKKVVGSNSSDEGELGASDVENQAGGVEPSDDDDDRGRGRPGPSGMKGKGPNRKQGKKDKEGKKDKGGEELTYNAKTIGVPMGGYPMHPPVPGAMVFENPNNQKQPCMTAVMMGERVAYWNCICTCHCHFHRHTRITCMLGPPPPMNNKQ